MLNETKIGTLLVIVLVVTMVEASLFESASDFPMLNWYADQKRSELRDCIEEMITYVQVNFLREISGPLEQKVNGFEVNWQSILLKQEKLNYPFAKEDMRECSKFSQMLATLPRLECRKTFPDIQLDEGLIDLFLYNELGTLVKIGVYCNRGEISELLAFTAAEANSFESAFDFPMLNSDDAQMRSELRDCIEEMITYVQVNFLREISGPLEQKVSTFEVNWQSILLGQEKINFYPYTIEDRRECSKFFMMLTDLSKLECRKTFPDIQFDEELINLFMHNELGTLIKIGVYCNSGKVSDLSADARKHGLQYCIVEMITYVQENFLREISGPLEQKVSTFEVNWQSILLGQEKLNYPFAKEDMRECSKFSQMLATLPRLECRKTFPDIQLDEGLINLFLYNELGTLIKIGVYCYRGEVSKLVAFTAAEASSFESTSSWPMLNSDDDQKRSELRNCIKKMTSYVNRNFYYQIYGSFGERVSEIKVNWKSVLLGQEKLNYPYSIENGKECIQFFIMLATLLKLKCRKTFPDIQLDEGLIKLFLHNELGTLVKIGVYCNRGDISELLAFTAAKANSFESASSWPMLNSDADQKRSALLNCIEEMKAYVNKNFILQIYKSSLVQKVIEFKVNWESILLGQETINLPYSTEDSGRCRSFSRMLSLLSKLECRKPFPDFQLDKELIDLFLDKHLGFLVKVVLYCRRGSIMYLFL